VKLYVQIVINHILEHAPNSIAQNVVEKDLDLDFEFILSDDGYKVNKNKFNLIIFLKSLSI